MVLFACCAGVAFGHSLIDSAHFGPDNARCGMFHIISSATDAFAASVLGMVSGIPFQADIHTVQLSWWTFFLTKRLDCAACRYKCTRWDWYRSWPGLHYMGRSPSEKEGFGNSIERGRRRARQMSVFGKLTWSIQTQPIESKPVLSASVLIIKINKAPLSS